MAAIVPGRAAHAHVCGVPPRVPTNTPVRFDVPIATEMETARQYAIALPDSFRATSVSAEPYPSTLEGRIVVVRDVPSMSCATVTLAGSFTKPGRYVLPVEITQPSGRVTQYRDPRDMLAPAPEVIVTRGAQRPAGTHRLVIAWGIGAVVLVAGAAWAWGGRRR